ncbi:MAG TPA: pectate lyase [Pyrinomonadaceae bacterium]|nr:pectate lyase [Pyrinomonadaceae bacterium]
MLRTIVTLLLVAIAALSVNAADITVAADGTGDVRTVQAAIDRVPINNKKRFVIAIKPGMYVEQVRVPANKPYVSFIGTDAAKTIIAFSLSNKEAGSTSASYAVYIGGHDFYAENVTFENSFGQGSQAVAVLVEADRSIFNKCRFLGWQDTLYAKNGRQYYVDSYIEGHVDYIFGMASAVFENCHIHSKADGYITAPMRFAADEPAGFIFHKCRVTSNNTKNGIYLGRPWRDYGRTVFLNTELDADIRKEGWHHWEPHREKTAYFAEYGSTGKGSNPEARVAWTKKLGDSDIKVFSVEYFLSGKDGWDPYKSNNFDWQEKTPPDWKLVTWNEVMKQKPLWYQTDEAARIGDQLLLYQKSNGGFEKNIDMALMLTKGEREKLAASRDDIRETTIDNKATYTQIDYLGKLITASMLKASPPGNLPKYKDAYLKGVDYLLSSQYENGGFPQFFPLKKGYYTHITYNDDAMIGVLELLRDISEKADDHKFIDEERRKKCEAAVEKGLTLTIKLQVSVKGKPTIWAAQYDEVTLQPAKARAFEPISLTGGESVAIIKFLMGVKQPSKEVIAAIESSIAWYQKNRITGFKLDRKMTPEGWKYSLVKDPTATPLWGRFYELSTMKPVFVGRDSIIKYDIKDLDPERASGYTWYVSSPQNLIEKDYPKWKQRVASGKP